MNLGSEKVNLQLTQKAKNFLQFIFIECLLLNAY